MSTAPQDRNDFQVAIFCALPLEAESVQSVFDVCWEDQDVYFGKAPGDQNTYTTGVIANYNVVLVHMPDVGGNSAALAAAGLRSSYRRIQLALLVGICGVAPVHPVTKDEIVLGDVIISTAMVQYDFGRQYPDGFRRKDKVEDSLSRSSLEIRSFINMLKIRQNRRRFNKKLDQLVQSKDFQDEIPTAVYPGVAHDRLYEASYVHQHRSASPNCDKCVTDFGTCAKHCDELGCEDDRLVPRKRHASTTPEPREAVTHAPTLHLGRFGSANTVMRSGLDRDRISATDEVAAFEMEGAGVWEQYPTIVIKAACDYCDSHKHKKWQDYAAAMAAACLKVFLTEWIIEAQQFGPVEYATHDVMSTVDISLDESSGPAWHVPFDIIPGFVGREDELQLLENKLFESNGSRIVALLGLGGVGKSRLALEVAFRTKFKQPQCSVFWIHASESSTLENDMLEIGKKLDIPGIESEKADIKVLVKQRLSLPSVSKWLLIIDNADDEMLWGRRSGPGAQGSSLADCLPRTTNGSILITTRTRHVASFLAGKGVIKLGAIPPEEAADLFISKLENHESVSDQESLSILMNKLANLPLAIVQAASYVNMLEISAETYLELLDQPESEVIRLLSKDFGDASRYPDAINPVATTWLISFERIHQQHALAAKLLTAMACFHEKGIPLSLLPKVDSKIDMIESLAVLTGYSFVTKQSRISGAAGGEDMYDIHSLVRLAVRSWLVKEEKLSEQTKTSADHLIQIFPVVNHQHRPVWAVYLPHVQRIYQNCKEGGLEVRYELLEIIGYCSLSDGKYNEAVETLSAVVSWREKTQSTSGDDILRVYNYLGWTLQQQGNYLEAEKYLLKAVIGYVASLGKSDHRTLTSMNHLGSVLAKQGRYLEAVKTYREVLQWSKKVLGRTHPQTLGSINDLATALADLGEYFEAEQMYREVLEVAEATGVGKYADVLTFKHCLVRVLIEQGKYDEANEICRELFQLRTTMLGKDHPETLSAIYSLAYIHKCMGDPDEAVKLFREVLPARQRILGNRHPDTLLTMTSLAAVLDEQGQHIKAEELCREALQLSKTVLGEDHHQTLFCKYNLAGALKGQGRFEEAVELLRCCTRQMTDVLGPTHPHTQQCCVTLFQWLINRPTSDE